MLINAWQLSKFRKWATACIPALNSRLSASLRIATSRMPERFGKFAAQLAGGCLHQLCIAQNVKNCNAQARRHLKQRQAPLHARNFNREVGAFYSHAQAP